MASLEPILIEGARCFDGQTPLSSSVDVLLADGRIQWVGSGSAPADARRLDARGLTLLPGLIDTHVHLESPAVPDRTLYVVRTSNTLMAFYAAQSARLALEAGFTTLRTMGSGASIALRQAIERGLIQGPRLLCGGIVDMTGGHFDLLRPLNYPRQPDELADGEAGVRRAVRTHVRAGADFIKFATSGGVVSEGDETDWVTYSEPELRAIIEEAHGLKRRTACHAQGTESIKRALRVGVDTLEHGTFMDAEGLELLVRTQAILIPTLSFFHGVVTHGRALGLPEHWQRKAGPAYDAARESVRSARKAGARIAYGTDSAGRQAPHGANAGELALLVGLGFTPIEVLRAATSIAAEAIGLGAETGRIARGYAADVILVDGDPLADVALLADTRRIRTVIARGELLVQR